MQRIIKGHGPDAFAGISSARCTNSLGLHLHYAEAVAGAEGGCAEVRQYGQQQYETGRRAMENDKGRAIISFGKIS
mgnify:CR=1 FL=1